jgi:hypothetical protein
MEDATEEQFGLCPYNGTVPSFDVYGADRALAAKFTINASQTFDGILANVITITNSPSDLRFRILDSANAAVSGATVTVDKDYIVHGRDARVFFNDPVTLPAGTYRIVMDSASSNSSNYWRVSACDVFSATSINSGFIQSTTTNMSTTFTWSDDTDTISGLALFHAVDVAASGGGGGMRLAGHGGLAA